MDNKVKDYILKHSRQKDKELKYDFMPSLLEIIERPAHRAGTVIILGVFTLLAAIIVWACISKLDVVITSSGNIQPLGNLKIIKSSSEGTVKSINISEGEYINKGEVLIELDTRTLEIDKAQLDNQKKILEIQQEIYQKIKDEEVSNLKIENYDKDLKTYVQAILDAHINLKNTIDTLEMEKENADLSLQIAQLLLKEYKAKGTVAQRESQELAVEQAELLLEQAKLKVSDTKIQYSAKINSKLSEINSQLDEIKTSLKKYEMSMKHGKITAPVSGYVNSIGVNTIGETVTSAQELVTIVPDNTPVEMVCYVKNMDIADVKLGMETEMKLEAYPYNRFGTVKGIVKYISPSAFVSEQMGSVYLVKIEILNTDDNINIISGMSGNVEIKAGKRSVMDYFLEPIKRGFGESLKEK